MPSPTPMRALQDRVRRLELQVSANRREIEDLRAQLARLRPPAPGALAEETLDDD